MEKARGREFANNTVAVIGDSTFIHSGITGLIDVVYNRGASTVLILDNRTTGMTGHQNNPANGRDLYGNEAPELDLAKLCEAVGVRDVRTVDPFDLKGMERALKETLANDEPSVIIVKRPCALLDRKGAKPALRIDGDRCTGCKLCMGLGCPAIVLSGDCVAIDPTLCVGCALCARLCPSGAIRGGK